MGPAEKINILLVDHQRARLAVLETVLAEPGEVPVPVTPGEHALRELLAAGEVRP
jgi:CheY-like chemotaxis protein